MLLLTGVEEAFTAGVLEEAFTAGVLEEAFMAGVLEEAFTAGVLEEAFMAGVLRTSTAAGLEAFTAGVSGIFTAIAVSSTTIVFSFPASVSMGTRGGGIGVILIIGIILIIGVIRITLITRAHTTVMMRITTIRPTKPAMPALSL